MTKRTTTITISSIAALAVVSIFSVGFAKWAMVETDQIQLDGVILVDNVDTNSVNKFETTPVVDHSICFGIPTAEQIANYGISDPWLNVTGSKYEVLSTFIDLKVTGLTSTNFKSILEVGALTDNSNKYATAYSEGLVGALPAPSLNDLTYVSDNIARLTITFTWGSAFNGENPYKFYNSQAQTTTLEADASAKLTRLHSLLNGVSYTIKIATKNII